MRTIILLMVALLVAVTGCTGMSGSAAPTPTWVDSLTLAGPTADAQASPAGVITPTEPYPYMDHMGLKEYTLTAQEQLGSIPPLAHVRIDLVYVLDGAVYYAITAADGQTFEAARPDQIAPIDGAIRAITLTAQAPFITPTSFFDAFNGMGIYGLITLEDVSNIPAGTLVQLNYIRYEADGMAWYAIRSADGLSSEAREEQLALAPGVTPGPTITWTPAPATVIGATSPPTATFLPQALATPTAVYGVEVGSGRYALVTKEQVGPIAAGSRVRLTSSRFDGTHTIYGIMNNIGIAADAYENQLAFPGYTEGTPIPRYANVVGTQSYIVITMEQVGPIGIGELVRLTYSSYDGYYVHYGIATADGRTADAREDQLGSAGRDNGTWVPTQNPNWPDFTPTRAFADLLFNYGPGNYPLTPLISRGSVNAGEPVTLSSARRYDGVNMFYQVITADGRTSEYQENELRVRPDFTPQPTATHYATLAPTLAGGPTPTAVLGAEIGSEAYTLYTLIHLSGMPIGTMVKIAAARYDGRRWWYDIVAEDGQAATVQDYQLSRTPPLPGPVPTMTWTPSPTGTIASPPTPTMTFTPMPTPTVEADE